MSALVGITLFSNMTLIGGQASAGPAVNAPTVTVQYEDAINLAIVATPTSPTAHPGGPGPTGCTANVTQHVAASYESVNDGPYFLDGASSQYASVTSCASGSGLDYIRISSSLRINHSSQPSVGVPDPYVCDGGPGSHACSGGQSGNNYSCSGGECAGFWQALTTVVWASKYYTFTSESNPNCTVEDGGHYILCEETDNGANVNEENPPGVTPGG